MSPGKRAPFAFFMFCAIVGAVFLIVALIDGRPARGGSAADYHREEQIKQDLKWANRDIERLSERLAALEARVNALEGKR